MYKKPTHEEMEARIKTLEHELADSKKQDNTIIRFLSEEFKQLANRSQDAIYQFDIESRTFSFFNTLFLSLYSIEESGGRVLSPKSVLLHIHPDDRAKVKAARALSFEPPNTTGDIEYRLLENDGTIRVMHDRWSVVRDPDGTPVTIEGFIRDNTWRHQVEKEFELSLHNSPIGGYIVQDARFRYVNPEFMRITGYGKDELIGTEPLHIVQPQHRSQARKNCISMLKGVRQFPYEFLIDNKEGNPKWILETATSIQYQGRRAGMCYFMDISKVKQAENEHLEKEKLLSVLEIAGAVGHELNNPLQVVSICTEKMAPALDVDERQTKLYRLLKKNVEEMRKIIHKFQNITQYATKAYVCGKMIIDLDKASAQMPDKASGQE
jgi:PAS domain S-box-containing protein